MQDTAQQPAVMTIEVANCERHGTELDPTSGIM